MRWMASIIAALIISLGLGGWMLWRYPGSLYLKWLSGEGYNRYYEIPNYRPLLLKPVALESVPEYKEEYPELWKDFPIRSMLIPLPVRHPFFNTVPILEYDRKSKAIHLGMTFVGATGRENSRLYALPVGFEQDYTSGAELFKLPYVKNRLVKVGPEELWKDVFTKVIVPERKSLDEMIYDLYLLYIRSKVLPRESKSYGLIPKSSTAIIGLDSKDKDYFMEMVMIQNRGSIYSYVLRTEKNSPESRKLRAKFLTSITFSPTDSVMARILYTEFKQLPFVRQVDQEGMLYLFSAWSQDTSSQELLREIIFYLERGSKYPKHLAPFYKYAFARYGKTFTTRDVFMDFIDSELALQRKIELEALSKRRDIKDKIADPGPELTPDERMNLYLKKAKEALPKKKDEMVIH